MSYAYRRVNGGLELYSPTPGLYLHEIIQADHTDLKGSPQYAMGEHMSQTVLFDEYVFKAPDNLIDPNWPGYIEQECGVLALAADHPLIPDVAYDVKEQSCIYFGMPRERRVRPGYDLCADNASAPVIAEFMIDFAKIFSAEAAKKTVRLNAGYNTPLTPQVEEFLAHPQIQGLGFYPDLKEAMEELMERQASQTIVVFHNDLCPEHILVDDSTGKVRKFIDFGNVYKGSHEQVVASMGRRMSQTFAFAAAVKAQYKKRTGADITDRGVILCEIAEKAARHLQCNDIAESEIQDKITLLAKFPRPARVAVPG